MHRSSIPNRYKNQDWVHISWQGLPPFATFATRRTSAGPTLPRQWQPLPDSQYLACQVERLTIYRKYNCTNTQCIVVSVKKFKISCVIFIEWFSVHLLVFDYTDKVWNINSSNLKRKCKLICLRYPLYFDLWTKSILKLIV